MRYNSVLFSALFTMIVMPVSADDIDIYTSQEGGKKPNILFVLDYSGSMAYDVDKSDSPPDEDLKINILKSTLGELLEDNINTINAGVGSLYGHTTTGIRTPISELNADANTLDPDITAGEFTIKDIMVKHIEERRANGLTVTVDALVEAAQYFRGDEVTHNDDPDEYDDDDYDAEDGKGEISRYKPHSWDPAREDYFDGHSKAALSSSYSPNNAYSESRTETFYCNNYSKSGGPNYCENKSTSSCTNRTSSDSITEGFERLSNIWGDYRRCEYQRNADWVGARYNSPITGICQANAIVLISDGMPSKLNDGESLKSILGHGVSGCEDLGLTTFATSDDEYKQMGNCGPEIVTLLANNDQIDGVDGSHVDTYTVGFDIDGNGEDYLKQLAAAGNGAYFGADSADELSTALNTIISDISTGTDSFVSLTVDVDKASYSNDNRVYFNLFSPSSKSSWNGNLKGYFFDETGFTDTKGDAATDIVNGGLQFDEDARSFWSADTDGNEVEAGGANEQVIDQTRNLYTYTQPFENGVGVDLSAYPDTLLQKSNAEITHTMMGLADGSSTRESALDWIQSAAMGDPLHSKSVTVNYDGMDVIYVMTNQGFIHAIDATYPTVVGDTSGGSELFAFMPKRLLQNLPSIYTGVSTGSHIYGLDGSITRWHTDDNNDGIVNNSERVLLIFGMRRGGTAYYALDVSKPAAPKLSWVIDDTNPSFPELAQSWSRMSLITVMRNGVEQKVLAFAAGYDADKLDDATARKVSTGNAIYMIDDEGNLLWTANQTHNSRMKYSIASDLTVIDSDGDLVSDRIYVGDVGGNVWRVDFDDIDDSPDVTRFANLDDDYHQPLFYAPSVALNTGTGGSYLSVSIGSGNRTNPLLVDSHNKIYMLRDMDVEKGAPASSSSTIKFGNLYDATANDIGSTNSATALSAEADLESSSGWYISLADDEKALSKLVTFEGSILATTFEADSESSTDSCGIETIGRFYQMDVANATPIGTSSDTTTGDTTTRYQTLSGFGIPSTPIIIFTDDASVAQIVVDRETVGEFELELRKVFWHAK